MAEFVESKPHGHASASDREVILWRGYLLCKDSMRGGMLDEGLVLHARLAVNVTTSFSISGKIEV